MSKSELSHLKDSELIAEYNNLRDKRKELKAEYDKADAGLRGAQHKIEIELLRRMQERGVDTMAARGIGTAYTSTVYSVTTADKEAFFEYIQKENDWDLADIRPAKSAVVNFTQEFGAPPPGVNVQAIKKVNVRRSS